MNDRAHAEHDHAHPNYIRVWALLLMLLVVSVAGPMLGVQIVTLITAFGIAAVKAYLVAKNFMHINVERRFIPYIIGTVLVFTLLFFAGSSPDVMEKQGTRWEKPLWLHPPAVAQEQAEHGGAHAEHGE
jgi:caa(3)-type oxidase subunit IV